MLITAVMYDLLPWLKAEKIDLFEAFILVDLKLCEIEQKPEEIEQILSAFKDLNCYLSLRLSADLEVALPKAFEVAMLNLVREKPALFSKLVEARQEFYKSHYPQVLDRFNQIKSEIQSAQRRAA